MITKRSYLVLISLLLPIGLVFFAQAHLAAEAARWDTPPPYASSPVKIVQQSDDGLSFVLETAVFQPTPDNHPQINGLDATLNTPGAPMLPYYSAFIALPPEAEMTIEVERETAVGYRAPANLAFAPPPEMAYSNDAQNEAFPATPTAEWLLEQANDPEFDREAWYPTAVYQLSEPIYYRDMRLVHLKLFPLRYHATHNQLEQTSQMRVSISYTGADFSQLQPLPGDNSAAYHNALRPNILNFEQGMSWRHLPQTLQDLPGPGLPIGVDTYKIHLDEDGIYEISGAELAAAGMDLSQVDPNTIQMMHRNQPVAYQFIGNPGDGFQPTDAIRFFGAAFTGSRLETQFISDNIYWLWAGGSPTYIAERANSAGQGQPILTTFRSRVTEEPELVYHGTWTNRWNEFPNEPDNWYWAEVRQQSNPIVTRNYNINLPHPTTTGNDPYYEVELLSIEPNNPPANLQYNVQATINSYPVQGSLAWQGLRNVNLTGTQPITTLLNGVNAVRLTFTSTLNARHYLNRITVEYDRHLMADANQLFFHKQQAPGEQQFLVNNFSENDPTQFLAWDISNTLQPEIVTLSGGDISGVGPYTITFTSGEGENGRYLATTLANIQSVKQLSQYIPHSLEPAYGADWVAITHNLFLTEAQRLATHRADPQFGGLTTHIVDIEDLINQYGYGLPLPEAIRHYLGYALTDWPIAPGYVVLVGGGTINPRNLNCFSTVSPCNTWNPNQPNFVLTDNQFIDRYQGSVPTDHTFVTLIGDDLVPDIAIGRLVANTIAEANNIVSKIIQYDQNHLTPTEIHRHYAFVADSTDSGGNFCLENSNAGNKLPPSLQQGHMCLVEPSIAEANRVRSEMASLINQDEGGINILNYRGHGSVQFWVRNFPLFNVNHLSSPSSYPGQVYITTTTNFWFNTHHPLIIISADCLDGYFAIPGMNALSRTFMAMPGVGTAAHWSSTGLGFTFEHTILVDALYKGAFDLGLPALGDAINHAKLVYYLSGQHVSELYSFTLQGDPAMQIYRPDLSLEKSSPQSQRPVYPGDEVTFRLTVQNNGIFASKIVLTDELPLGLEYETHSASAPLNATINGRSLTFTLTNPLAWGESAVVTVTAVAQSGLDGPITNQATVQSSGWDINPADNVASATITLRDTDLRLSKSSPQSEASLYPGDEAIFHLELLNSGISANSIILTDHLPIGLTYLDHSASVPVSLDISGSDLRFTLQEPLPAGQSAQLIVTTTVDGSAAGLLTNAAIARGEAGEEDSADATVLAYRYDMRLEKTTAHGEDPLHPDDPAIFHLLLSNDGILAATDLVLIDQLPTGLQYLGHNASVPVNFTANGLELHFALKEPLPPGQSASVILTTTVTGSAFGLLTNNVTVHSTEWGINPANNAASASIYTLPKTYWIYLPLATKP
jgi:uncharacterized repeat protein (TIGR01451 family)